MDTLVYSTAAECPWQGFLIFAHNYMKNIFLFLFS